MKVASIDAVYVLIHKACAFTSAGPVNDSDASSHAGNPDCTPAIYVVATAFATLTFSLYSPQSHLSLSCDVYGSKKDACQGFWSETKKAVVSRVPCSKCFVSIFLVSFLNGWRNVTSDDTLRNRRNHDQRNTEREFFER